MGKKVFKNMGAYVVKDTFQQRLSSTKDVIEVLNVMNLSGHSVTAFQYFGTYLHIETPADIAMWKQAL